MGAHDNEEIIELTDVIDDAAFSPSSSKPTQDFPLEQAIDPKDLEDEFEQLLRDAPDDRSSDAETTVDDDLDIESLFEEMEQGDTSSSNRQDDPHVLEQKDDAGAALSPASDPDMDDLEDLFASLDDDASSKTSSSSQPDISVQDQDMDELLTNSEPSLQPDNAPLDEGIDEAKTPATDSGTDDLFQDQTPGESEQAPAEHADVQELQKDPLDVPATDHDRDAAESLVDTHGDAAMAPVTDDPMPADAPASIQKDEPSPDLSPALSADKALLESLQERVASLEAQTQTPPQPDLFAQLAAFFQESAQGRELLEDIAGKVTSRMEATTKQLVEEKLDMLDVPSSEEINAAVREEIRASVAENLPTPPDTKELVREIRQDLQQRVQDGMDEWETQRMELRTDLDAIKQAVSQTEPLDKAALIRDIREDLQRRVQEGMDQWEAQRMALQETVDTLQANQSSQPLDRQTLVQEIRQDLQQRVQEGMDAWEAERVALRTELEDLRQTVSQTEPLDRQALIRDIREELQRTVQEGMDQWEVQKSALSREMDDLRQTVASADVQAQIKTITSTMVAREELQAVKEELMAALSREIPKAAAQIIREEIAALMNP
ncbi:hypothetical protein [Desulfoplanes formicivorans]|uniref:Uncharacterized protein n=1 Tax=Desulfoplanes formicivorans TaxID=1592317 RepID=A0A194AG53_9BACT|nr:hypothetical protein [Desulfoplanes formicivorans]GAU08303.1 hypothetical protein DPF_1009 [Desulfoplanes formicivorans]